MITGSKYCIICGRKRTAKDKIGVMICDKCHEKEIQMKTWVDFVEDSMNNSTLEEGLMRADRTPEGLNEYFKNVGYGVTLPECSRIIKLMQERRNKFQIDRVMY
jgi:hypothetical protein